MPPTGPGVIEDLRATQGGTINEPVINLSWLPAIRAERYLIEVSVDHRQTWQPAGTGVSLITQHSFAIEPGDISVRVAAIGMVRGPWAYIDLVAGGDFEEPGQVQVSLAEPFTGNALRVTWEEEPAAARYLIEVWSGDTFRRSLFHERGMTDYSYHYLDAQQDGAGRTLTVKVRAVNAQNMYGDWGELTATNPPPAVPDQVKVHEYMDSFAITAAQPNETVKELRVYGSQSEGFEPQPENFLAHSSTTRVNINESGVWFFRVAWVDNWGEAALNFSGEFRGESASVDWDSVFPIDETDISDDAISTPKLQANAVTAEKVGAKEINAEHILVEDLSAISADIGKVTAGTLTTDAYDNGRVVITSDGELPLWIGSGDVSVATGAMYYDKKLQTLFSRNMHAENLTVNKGEFIDVKVTGEVEATHIKAGTVDIIDTLMLRENSVCFPVTEQIRGEVRAGGSIWRPVLNKTFEDMGNRILLLFTCTACLYVSNRMQRGLELQVRISVDGSIVHKNYPIPGILTPFQTGGSSNSISSSLSVSAMLQGQFDGRHTVNVEVFAHAERASWSSSSGIPFLGDPALTLLALKR